MSKYRRKDSYASKDPERRAKQLANLPQYQKNGESIIATPDELKNMDIITFAEQQLRFKLFPTQAVILKVIYGLPLTNEELSIYKTLTKREVYKPEEVVEAVLALGARSGKSMMVSIMALYEAICRADKWRSCLCPGELGYVVVIATKQTQAEDIIGRNCARLLNGSLVEHYLRGEPLKAAIELRNDMKIVALPCNSTAGRGIPIFCLIFDEIAHFFSEGPRADVDIYDSLLPRLAQFSKLGPKTFMLSTPAAKQGLFYKWFKEGFEVPGRATFHASTLFMNPGLGSTWFEKQRLRDPDNYAREFLALFSEKMYMFFTIEKLEASLQISEDIPPQGGCHYFCAIDQSGGGDDRFGLGIVHREQNGTVLVDVARAFKAKKLLETLDEIKAITGPYKIHKLTADNYSFGWVQQNLAKIGIEAEKRRGMPEIYRNAKGLMERGLLVMPSYPELRAGLINTVGCWGNNTFGVTHDRTSEGHADMTDAVISAIDSASTHNEDSGLALGGDDVYPRDGDGDIYSTVRSSQSDAVISDPVVIREPSRVPPAPGPGR
jgi:hypothetical protein